MARRQRSSARPVVSRPALAARGESPAAVDRRCIPKLSALGHFLQGSNTAGILPRRALHWTDAASTTSLGATLDFHHGLLARPRSSPAAHQRDNARSASEVLQPLAERDREPGRPAIVDLGDEPAGADVPFVQPLDLSEKGVGSQGLVIETVCEVVVGDLTMAGPSRVGDRAPSMQEIGRPDECVTLGNREKSPFEF